MRKFSALTCIATILIALLISCSGPPSPTTPREAVIALFGAMERNDRAAIAHLVDLESLMKNSTEDYALQTDSPRIFSSPEDILSDLTDKGITKTRWFAYQRIVNETEMIGDGIANVEVTFVDKESSQGYMTKFGVHMSNGKWKVFSFNNTENYDTP